MQANLSWPQAKILADSGSIVRRAGWLTRSIFNTRGNLYWLDVLGTKRVITASDFTRADYLALDYTDSAPDQGHCLKIDIASEMAASPSTLGSGATSVVTLTISKAVQDDLPFALSSDSSLLTVPATVTIPAGSLSVTFNAVAGSLSNSSNATITASSVITSCSATIPLQYIAPPPPPPPPKKILTFSDNQSATPQTTGWVWIGPVNWTLADANNSANWVFLGSGRPTPHPRVPPSPQAVTGSPIVFSNPWSQSCNVLIEGTFWKQLNRVQGATALSINLPIAYTMAAGETSTLTCYGDTQRMSYNITVTLSL